MMTLAALTLSGGVALADRDRGHNRRDNRVERRDNHRHDRSDRARWNRGNTRVDRSRHSGGVRVVRSRPSFRNNTFYFANGHTHRYQRPVIRHRYYNYYQRPAIIVENYAPVAGYVWVAGQWNWNGYEWIWVNGHYEVDANFDGYGDGY